MRRAAKVDANHSAIGGALRAYGCRVVDCSRMADGFPDLLVGVPANRLGGKRIVLVEIKDGKQRPSARRLTDLQMIFHEIWQGWPVYVVKSVDEALAAVGAR